MAKTSIRKFRNGKTTNRSSLSADPITATFPVGAIIPYSGLVNAENTIALATAGWLVCDGAAVSRSRYSRLYQVIGDIHGRGDATSTFNLPDYRGRFLRGADTGAGRDPDAARRIAAAPGGLTGDNVGSIQADEIRAHDHQTIQMIGDNNIDGVDSTTTHSGEHHNEERRTGVWGGSETRPVNANVNWLILAGR